MVWAVASAAFVLIRLAPGDASVDIDNLSAADVRAAEVRRLGLDRPWPEQYASWLGGALRLDFGESSLYARPVGHLVRERAFNTAILAAAALALAGVLGVSVDVFTAIRHGTAAARLARFVSMLLLSTPPLVASLVLVLIAARTGLALVEELQPDLLVTGIMMPPGEFDGIELVRRSREKTPALKPIVLSLYDDSQHVDAALVPVLVEAAGSADYQVQSLALDLLAKVGGPEQSAALRPLLDSENPYVAISAAHALLSIRARAAA